MTRNETLKAYLTVSEVIDRCILSGLESANLPQTEPIRVVSVNGLALPNETIGMCTIGFIKSQVERKKQLAQQLENILSKEAEPKTEQ